MNLPIIDLLSQDPIKVFDRYRNPTYEEYKSGKYGLTTPVGEDEHLLFTAEQIATWSIDHSGDVRRELEIRLRESETFKIWRSVMPNKVPEELAVYRNSYARADLGRVDASIKSLGVNLTAGQVLFHGGYLESGRLRRPLSTTFCPEVARQEALWKGKADAIGSVNIYIIGINSNSIGSYVYNLNAGHGDELEVLLSSGGVLSVEETLCRREYNKRIYQVILAHMT